MTSIRRSRLKNMRLASLYMLRMPFLLRKNKVSGLFIAYLVGFQKKCISFFKSHLCNIIHAKVCERMCMFVPFSCLNNLTYFDAILYRGSLYPGFTYKCFCLSRKNNSCKLARGWLKKVNKYFLS